MVKGVFQGFRRSSQDGKVSCRRIGIESYSFFTLFQISLNLSTGKNMILIFFTGPGMWLMQALFEDKVGAVRIFSVHCQMISNYKDSLNMILCTKGQVTTTVLEVCKVFLFGTEECN